MDASCCEENANLRRADGVQSQDSPAKPDSPRGLNFSICSSTDLSYVVNGGNWQLQLRVEDRLRG